VSLIEEGEALVMLAEAQPQQRTEEGDALLAEKEATFVQEA
jgi:hypothetical protein